MHWKCHADLHRHLIDKINVIRIFKKDIGQSQLVTGCCVKHKSANMYLVVLMGVLSFTPATVLAVKQVHKMKRAGLPQKLR